MSTRWAISPTDGRTHVLLPVGDHPLGMFQARCGHLLPQGVALHECLPGLLLCVRCLWRYLVPAPAFPGTIPAGRRLRDAPESTPDGQPVPLRHNAGRTAHRMRHLHLFAPARASIEDHRSASAPRARTRR
jgi:hypothetical protein